jgi:hypothetical protein
VGDTNALLVSSLALTQARTFQGRRRLSLTALLGIPARTPQAAAHRAPRSLSPIVVAAMARSKALPIRCIA